MAHKRLIAFMLATMLATATLTGCGVEKTEEEISYEDEIRQSLEYDANTNLSREDVKNHGFGIDYTINNDKFYIIFKTYTIQNYGKYIATEADAKIKYEVDKDMYYDFKNNYSLHEKSEDVERVKELVEKYDPVEVINPTVNNIEK